MNPRRHATRTKPGTPKPQARHGQKACSLAAATDDKVPWLKRTIASLPPPSSLPSDSRTLQERP
ncbi:hypothetical protein DPMN_164787 [Dreissena polymorpha]|uniref:Uncharacterized protein n=1 Tax=Dreissena polymorpha TaxID=45954 RepID=A0A9D4IVR8_DREPO|nr:hypothetical protein DPMN_164787 [Dreissena polymorpha]